MSKVEMPLMSEKASGKFADGLVYYDRYGKTICRRYVKNDGGDSEVLRKNRNLFKEAIEFSKLLTVADKAAWNKMSQGTNLNGHNLFMRAAMNSFHQGHDFKPIYGVEFVTGPEDSRGSDGSEADRVILEVNYQAGADLEYYLIVGEGSFANWDGGDTLTGIGVFDGLVTRVEGLADSEGKGSFLVNGLESDRDYWLRLVRPEGDGISAVYEIIKADNSA
ncbi:MAG: hypothetical protein ABR596_04280 [Halarsenatibacteraceae bacterium]